jgi:hypothetical protein
VAAHYHLRALLLADRPELAAAFPDEQFPDLDETVGTFAGSGFTIEVVERVVQHTCSSLRELAARTRLRPDTTLALMTDTAFAARQAALEQAVAVETEPTPVIDTVDLVVLRKAAA